MKHLKLFRELNERESAFKTVAASAKNTQIVALGKAILTNLSDIQKSVQPGEKAKINFIKALVWKYKEGDRHITEDELDLLYDKYVLQRETGQI